MYSGKCQALGIKPQGNSANNHESESRWSELTVPKAAKIIDFAVGHDGHHALLLSEDNSVYFVGTAKKGEDGDSSSCKEFFKSFFMIIYLTHILWNLWNLEKMFSH